MPDRHVRATDLLCTVDSVDLIRVGFIVLAHPAQLARSSICERCVADVDLKRAQPGCKAVDAIQHCHSYHWRACRDSHLHPLIQSSCSYAHGSSIPVDHVAAKKLTSKVRLTELCGKQICFSRKK